MVPVRVKGESGKLGNLVAQTGLRPFYFEWAGPKKPPVMDHAAKKSPDSVPPFEGLTRVVVGEEYPPGAYFGQRGSTFKYEIPNVARCHTSFGQNGRPIMVKNPAIKFSGITAPIWFRAAIPPSDPCIQTDKPVRVNYGDTVQPGRLTSVLADGRGSVMIVLEDENRRITTVNLYPHDFYVVDTPTVVYFGSGPSFIKWHPIE